MLTKLEILTEYGRCLSNPTYAIESYLTTFDKTQEGFVPFQLFPRQKEIIQAYEKHRFNLVAKPRQAGVSTTTAAYMAIKGAFADKKNPEAILIIANKQDLAFEFLGKIKDFVSQLPRWVWGSEYYGTPEKEALTIFSTDSKKEIKLPNGSRIKAVATSKGALRGFTPTYLIMDEAAHIDNGAEVFSTSLTALGCLTKDSLILTDNGLVELNELVIEKDVLGFSDLESPHIVCDKFGELTPATKTFVSEYGKTFKIKTKLGIELEGSWKHPLLIKRGGEELWVKMSELIIGDKPLINYNQNYFGKNSGYIFDFTRNSKHKNIEIPKLLSDNLDFCYLLGLFVSEGNFYNGGITITNKDKYISDFLINDKAGLNHSFKLVDDRHHSLSSIELVKWFESFGLKKHNARDKEIPLAILKMPKEVIVNFLQGMFDGDGMSTTKDIKYSSTSKKLIQTLQTLLLNFGIVSHIKKEIQKTSISSIIPNKDHICTIYNLKIYSDYAIKFYDEIGFRLDRKQINKKYLINKKNNSRFVNVSQNDILKILKNNNIPKYDVRFLERFWSSKYERLSYESLKQLIIKLPDNKLLNELLLQKKYNEKYFLDEIVDIQFGEDYTYDLHVPKTNSFISNGLISHNTGGHCILISCVTKDTFIFTDNGVKQIKDFIDYSKLVNPSVGYVIPEYTILGVDGCRSSNLFVNNGLQNTIKLKSTSSDLEGTYTHKLWAFSNKEKKYDWFKMSELEIGDYINIQHGFNLCGNNDEINFDYSFSNKEKKPNKIFTKIDSDLAYLIGLYISEGSSYKVKNKNNEIIGHNITITCGDSVSEAITNAGFNYSSHDNLHYTISSKYFGSLLEYLGFDLNKKANEKLIPNRLLSMSKTNIIGMLQGIMDGDGYSDVKRGRIGLNMSSKLLVKQVRALFLNFGILTDYQTGFTPKTKKVNVVSEYFRISASSIYAKKFYDEIGFRFIRKQNKKESLPVFKNYNQSEFIPNGKEIIRSIINDFGLTRKLSKSGLKINSLRCNSKTKDLNLNKFLAFVSYFEKTLNLNLDVYNIDKILINNGKWEKITNKSLSKNETFDFSLPNNEKDFWCHSVIYNGILGHQTPNGMDALYYTTYENAKNSVKETSDGTKVKTNNFNVVEMRWYEDLRYNKGLTWFKGDITEPETVFNFESYEARIADGWKPMSPWYEYMCLGMNGDARMIAQELDVSFIGSGGNVVAEEFIEFQTKNNQKDPIRVINNGETWIWADPEEGHQYIQAVDVSRGDSEDSSTIIIIDFTTMEEVLEYKGKIQPDLLAQLVEEYGNAYKAYTIVDITGGMGVSTVLKLLEFQYKYLHYDTPNGKILSSKQRELTNYGKTEKIPGFHATSVRIPMISNLEYQVRTNGIKIRSRRLLSEFKTFVYKNGRPDHMDGFHDDLIMALGMGLWVLEYSFKNLQKLEKQSKAMLGSWIGGSNSNKSTQLENERGTNFVSKNKVVTPKPKFNPVVARNMQDPNGQYMWLFSGSK